jgi:hypothetical protein
VLAGLDQPRHALEQLLVAAQEHVGDVRRQG